jgi:hypothetical protein
MNKNTSAESSSTPHTDDKSINIKWLWLAMQGIYPNKWNAAMGEVTGSDGKLSVQARTWQRGLSGVSNEQIATAIDRLTDNYNPFVPDLGEFRALCTQRADVPTVEQIVQILANSVPRQGTVADRFQHPMALAVMQHASFDYHCFKTASTKVCIDMVKPVHADLMQSGWECFKPEHYEEQRAIANNKPRDKSKALLALAEAKAATATACTAKLKSAQIIADESYFKTLKGYDASVSKEENMVIEA